MGIFKSRVQNEPYQLALFSSIVFLVVTMVISTEAYNKLKERNAALFDLRVAIAQKAIEKRMIDYIQILKGTQGLISMSDTVTRTEFGNYVENLHVEKNYPGVQGIGYTLFIQKDSKSEFEQTINASGFPEFKVWPSGPRALYSSILYLEPFDQVNRKAFGYDMYAEPVRKEAMERARDTGEAALSGAVVLVQEGAAFKQRGFNLYLPIFKKGTKSNTLEERRNNIKGYVYSPFRVNDLMHGILHSDFEDLNISVYDGTVASSENLLYRKSMKEDSARKLDKAVEMQLAGRNWNLIFTAASGFGQNKSFPYFLLGGGFIISVLIFFILLSFGYVKNSTHLKQVITDNATAGLFIINKSGVCTLMNPSAESLTGYSFKEMVNKHILELFYNKDASGNKKIKNNQLLQSLFDGELRDFESVLFTKSGKKIDVSINSRIIQQHSSKDSILLEIRNISREKKAEAELKERNKSLQTLNKIGTILSAELELRKLLQIITDSCTELTRAEFGAFFYNHRKEDEAAVPFATSGVATGDLTDFAHFYKNKILLPGFDNESVMKSDDITADLRYGRHVPNEGLPEDSLKIRSYLAVPVVSRNGSIIGSLIFGHSKTARFNKKSEEIVVGVAAQAAIAIDNSQLFESLSGKNSELLKINNDLDNFVYTASHDLKAPVLNIEGLVYALTRALEENRTEKISQMMDMIKKSILKFKETIQALTEVARTNKNVDEDFEFVDVAVLLDDIKLSIKDTLLNTKAEIETDLPCNEIYLSKSNLRSVIFNLITNAIKYRSPDRQPRVFISCIKDDDNILLEVQDNGIGIPKEHLHKIFLMFKRVHTHTEGTGIGLYLVKRIVENEGGTISVESDIEWGTKFTIRLPQKVPRFA